jgi:hypothetical protein
MSRTLALRLPVLASRVSARGRVPKRVSEVDGGGNFAYDLSTVIIIRVIAPVPIFRGGTVVCRALSSQECSSDKYR